MEILTNLKPIVAEILAEEPSIPEQCPNNPDPVKFNPELKETIKAFLEKQGNNEWNEKKFPTLSKLCE